MEVIKFYKGNKSNLPNVINNDSGVYVCEDTSELFVSSNKALKKITDILILNTEEERIGLITPIANKFYYIKENNHLFFFNGTQWNDILNNNNYSSYTIGEIRIFVNGCEPINWLKCDGSSLDTALYSDLYSVIGGSFGSSSTGLFNVPNLNDPMAGIGYYIAFRGEVPLKSPYLLNLKSDNIVFSPSFNYKKFSYSAVVDYNVNNAIITSIADDNGANINVNNQIFSNGTNTGIVNLNVGNNTIPIVVTNSTNTLSKTYNLTVKRLNGAFLQSILSSSGAISPSTVTKDNFTYTIKAGALKNSIIITLTSESNSSIITMKVDSNTYTSNNGVLTQTVPVTTTTKTATVTVSSTDSNTSSIVYTLYLSK